MQLSSLAHLPKCSRNPRELMVPSCREFCLATQVEGLVGLTGLPRAMTSRDHSLVQKPCIIPIAFGFPGSVDMLSCPWAPAGLSAALAALGSLPSLLPHTAGEVCGCRNH
jgi:hypothetical protein